MVVYNIGMSLEEVEKEVILKALAFFQGNKTQTASSLSISVRTIDNKLAKYRGEDVKNEAVVIKTNSRKS
jgi:DNA-binding NtrC family response regulator